MYHELPLIVLGVLYQGADGSSSHVMPLVFSFSNRNEPNRAQTFRMIRIGSVRDCFSVAPAGHVMTAWIGALAGICGCGFLVLLS